MANRRRNSERYRDVDGIVILDKGVGQSSNRALQQLRGIFRARKAGHCGSLDPMASGVLPICLGEATKFSSYLLNADKAYRAHCRLGQVSSTGDAEGEILRECPVTVDRDSVLSVLAAFTGEIEQVPPMYSALKHEGRRLYQLAREGKEVDRPARKVEISSLELVSLEADTLVFDAVCSKGTYIRTLAEDIGEQLGCGAHLRGLRRTRVDDFSVSDAVTLDHCQQVLDREGLETLDDCLLPVSAALRHFPERRLDAQACADVRHGKRLQVDVATVPGLYRLSAEDGEFIGLGEVDHEASLKVKRLMNTAR